MKKFKKWEIIFEDSTNVYKHYTIGTKADALKEIEGNGEVVRIKEIPDYLPDASRVRDDLRRCGYGEAEADMIYRLLYKYVEGTEPDDRLCHYF